MSANYGVYYYANNTLVFSHRLRNDHLCFILDRAFHTSPRIMGCQFSFSGNDLNTFCSYMAKFVYKFKTYVNKDFANHFIGQHNTSIDVIRFADLNDDVSDSESTK